MLRRRPPPWKRGRKRLGKARTKPRKKPLTGPVATRKKARRKRWRRPQRRATRPARSEGGAAAAVGASGAPAVVLRRYNRDQRILRGLAALPLRCPWVRGRLAGLAARRSLTFHPLPSCRSRTGVSLAVRNRGPHLRKPVQDNIHLSHLWRGHLRRRRRRLSPRLWRSATLVRRRNADTKAPRLLPGKDAHVRANRRWLRVFRNSSRS